MKTRKKPLTHAIGAIALGLSSAAGADGATGEMLAGACAGCHGDSGNSMGPAAPSIAAMDPMVFVDAMEAFKSGETYSTVMGRIAKGYSSQEFEKMGQYFKQQTYVPADQGYEVALVDEGARLHDKYCEKCHAEGGKPLVDEEDYSILAGQWTPYLQFAMSDFREDRREMEKKMRRKLEEMLEREGEESLDAVFSFYASQQ
ncbi:c-type cytochrome [Imhoffiella purpurea]|uniref:Cytochrome subunit of sulfide dehydrogenase n=1 Tax=Imhoffiella purpurea TaxID=1249627 RepID=W9V693_9GAMM|nr:sulfide dehydrogenase [Imhoffiella purpurea]EXJ14884.1 Cytochrome subunit of sulfide dehydrogenase precursor [Imhoffiella purpurea]